MTCYDYYRHAGRPIGYFPDGEKTSVNPLAGRRQFANQFSSFIKLGPI